MSAPPKKVNSIDLRSRKVAKVWLSRLAWRQSTAASALYIFPKPVLAHDAFGDLGPFYASLLHPLADPLQAALIVGTAAFLAKGPIATTKAAIPVFIGAATLSVIVFGTGAPSGFSVLFVASVAVLIGLATLLPDRWPLRYAAFVLVGTSGALAGGAPGALASETILQALIGSVFGVTLFLLLAWFALETASRHLSPLVAQVVGSWVAAIGILVAAFSI